MKTILIEPEDQEQLKAITTVLKAMKVKFSTSKIDGESLRILKSVAKGFKELKDVESGKIKARNIQDVLAEL
ncbi:MAG: hypothetical protein EP311_08335 [Cytophagales bacterium]|nr:MAG: hypothetical protein EP311_08335 [Cytophagales bacterium]